MLGFTLRNPIGKFRSIPLSPSQQQDPVVSRTSRSPSANGVSKSRQSTSHHSCVYGLMGHHLIARGLARSLLVNSLEDQPLGNPSRSLTRDALPIRRSLSALHGQQVTVVLRDVRTCCRASTNRTHGYREGPRRRSGDCHGRHEHAGRKARGAARPLSQTGLLGLVRGAPSGRTEETRRANPEG